MEWLNILALLACPLMMLFCMKGMFGGHKEGHGKKQDTSPEMQQLQLRMAEMEEQNNKLMQEIKTLKGDPVTKESTSNVVEMKKGVS